MKKNTLGEILLYVAIFCVGLLLVVWSDKVINIVSILLGCLAGLYGSLGIYDYVKNKNKEVSDNLQLIFSITLLVIGGILIFRVDFLKELISFIIGIYILLSSVIRLIDSIKVGKSLNTKITGAIVLSIIGIFIGIMCVVGKFLLPNVIVVYIGVMLIIYSIVSIINIIILRRK